MHQAPNPLVDRAIARLAARQHGVVTRAAARGAGPRARRDRERGCGPAGCTACTGRLRRRPPGADRATGGLMAAVLACGEGAVLSHRSAAELWRIGPARGVRRADGGPRGGGGRRGSWSHRRRDRPRMHDTSIDGIPVTTPARTHHRPRRRPHAPRPRARDRRGRVPPTRPAPGSSPIAGRRGAGALRRGARADTEPAARARAPSWRRCSSRSASATTSPSPETNEHVEWPRGGLHLARPSG